MDALTEKLLELQEAKRRKVMETSNRAHSALALAKMALEHDGGGAHAAANLLLAMENEKTFDFRLLLKFDAENRAHADLVMSGYQPHHIRPSGWMIGIGEEGTTIMQQLADKWNGTDPN